MNSQPIPRKILKNTAELYPYVSVDEFNAPTYGTKVDLSYVHGQPVKKTSLSALGEQKDDALLFFYDCANSLPAGQSFKELDKIVFGGQEYIVREAIPQPDALSGGVHHWELRLKSGGATS